MLTGTLKADWIQPVERYLAALSTMKQGVIAGVFKIKGASLELLSGPRSCRGVSSQWPVFGWLTCRGLCPAHSVAWCVYDGNQQFAQGGRLWFSHIRKKYDVQACGAISWGNIRPRWRLLQQHLKTKGSGTRWQKERSGSLPTDLIGLEMIWKMNFVLTMILMLGALAYCTGPTMAASSTSSTHRVSWWARNAY